MPATPSRIGVITTPYRSDIQSDTAIKTRYGIAARDTKDSIAESFFESLSDVTAMNAERFALLKGDRRRFRVTYSGAQSLAGGMDYSQTVPTVTFADDTFKASGNFIVASVESIDFQEDSTTLLLWG